MLFLYLCKYISSFLHAFVALCYLQNLKRGVALVFSADFLYALPKNAPYQVYTLSIDQVSISDVIPL